MTYIYFYISHNLLFVLFVSQTYLMEDLVDKIHIFPGGQQDGMHHVIDTVVLLFNATQTGIAGPSAWQCAAVRVTLLRLAHWPACIPVWRLLFFLLLAATARSDSLDSKETQSNLNVPFWQLSIF